MDQTTGQNQVSFSLFFHSTWPTFFQSSNPWFYASMLKVNFTIKLKNNYIIIPPFLQFPMEIYIYIFHCYYYYVSIAKHLLSNQFCDNEERKEIFSARFIFIGGKKSAKKYVGQIRDSTGSGLYNFSSRIPFQNHWFFMKKILFCRFSII
jgi:hypothetical protein